MIPLWGTFFAFCVIALITHSRTYFVLAVSALVNLVVDDYTSTDDAYLVLVYSTIDFFTCLFVLFFGDFHKIYQSSMIVLMLFLHYTMEAALSLDNVEFIESGIYTYAMTFLIIMQLIGAGCGMDKHKTLSWSDYHRNKDSNLSLFNH